ncbi:alpha/beta hydrolase [Halonotius terrestris]|uniref:Alpha/beta hydrolase n=1 Tax=Halonotius terrestris TaxID=2487750 RepID=A0A8J8TDM8_9EURY|nr:alpha/beta hydrolase [Halonotius terrestris]TQQ83457.1 alpha/beta hydrolase [Halonotius terrestris]
MSIRNLLAGTALGGGALAAVNRWLRSTATDLPPALDGEQHTYRWRGMDIAYTTAGDPENPPLVMLHGINAAGSSGEFREVFGDLAADYHVIAPDLPGFGRSDRPPLRYSATLYEEFVADFLAEYDEPSVVASSLSAAYVLGALETDNDADVSELLLICPTAIAGPDPPKEWLRELFRLPLLGTGLFNLIASKPSIRYFNADHGYYDIDNVADEWLDYEWQTTHQPNARFAPASFISGYLNADRDLAELIATLDVPTTILWGREADITPLSDGRELANEADADLVVFDNSMLLPHVEFPEQFDDVIDGQFAAIDD